MQKIICKDFSADPTVTTMRTSQLPPADRGPGQGWADPVGEEFLGRLGDEIDDRVAEVLPEILDEQAGAGRPGPSLALAAFGLVAGLAATFVLRDSAVAVCVAWLSVAVVCLAAALAGRRRP